MEPEPGLVPVRMDQKPDLDPESDLVPLFLSTGPRIKIRTGTKITPDPEHCRVPVTRMHRISVRIIRPFLISGIRPDTRLACRISGKAGYRISGKKKNLHKINLVTRSCFV
jgi:hypothetical protein